MKSKYVKRQIRHFRIRKKVSGTSICPRLSVFISNKHFYAQIIDDQNHHTLVAYSSLNLDGETGNNQITAAKVGKEIALLAKKKAITTVVFDRGGFLFHGKIKIFADTVRKHGLKF